MASKMAIFISLIVVAILHQVTSDCDVGNGKVFKDGEEFSFDEEGCIKYKCDGDKYVKTIAKCTHDGKCYEQGSKEYFTDCEKYQCVETEEDGDQIIGWVKISTECKYNDKCYKGGEKVKYEGKDCVCKSYETTFSIQCPPPNNGEGDSDDKKGDNNGNGEDKKGDN